MKPHLLALLALATACDYEPTWLYPEASDQAPVLYELFAEDGGPIVPVDVDSDNVQQNTIYAELGATTTAQKGGATFNFVGTGSDVCVLVDPEGVTWTEAVSPRLDEDSRPWSLPDNLYDDGDIDIYGGLSVYYTGSADELGDFKVRYTDPLGNPVEVSLSVCNDISQFEAINAHAGRATPEWCTFPATDLGVEYTVVLETWSTPLDDDRLSFGLVVANGDCNSLTSRLGGANDEHALECMIVGEALRPEEQGPWYGKSQVNDLIWGPPVDGADGFLEYEQEFCADVSVGRMDQFCEAEDEAVRGAGETCDWFGEGDGTVHCFCGDTTWSPDPGAF
jgi:hypothetical protein